MIDSNYPALSRALTESLLWRIAMRLAAFVDAAWPASITGRIVAAIRVRNVRLLASVAAIALAISIAAQFAIPIYVRPGLPLAWPLMLLALLIVIATWPAAFERAWSSSALARFSRIVKGG